MSNVTVPRTTSLAVLRGAAAFRPPAHPKAVLTSIRTGVSVALPYAPREMERGPWSHRWEEDLPEGAWIPNLRDKGPNLVKLKFTAVVGRPDYQESVETVLGVLRYLAIHDAHVVFAYGPSEGGQFVITEHSEAVEARQYGTNAITRARVSLTLTERWYLASWGRISRPAPSFHVIAAGETLAGLAGRYYGDVDRWPLIAEANGIDDPRDLQVGSRLTIPARL